MNIHYSAETYNEIKRKYVEQNLSPRKISQEFNGEPSWQTIRRWAKKDDWNDLREEYRNRMYEETSPKSLASKILKKIHRLMDDFDKEGNDKTADKIAKLSATMRKITDPKHQIHIMYQMLTDQVNFTRKYYEKVATKEYYEMIKSFKNYLRDRIETQKGR